MKILKLIPILFLLIAACTEKEEVIEIEDEGETHSKAVSVVYPIGESNVNGVVHFKKADGGVSVMAEFSGLEEGKYGFHIHQFGNCTGSDGKTAGGHFDPFMIEKHNAPDTKNRHMGDMGNISVDEDGTAVLSYVDPTILLNEIIGRGIVVHAGEDDLTSQPSGAAGPRIACGVIGVAE